MVKHKPQKCTRCKSIVAIWIRCQQKRPDVNDTKMHSFVSKARCIHTLSKYFVWNELPRLIVSCVIRWLDILSFHIYHASDWIENLHLSHEMTIFKSRDTHCESRKYGPHHSLTAEKISSTFVYSCWNCYSAWHFHTALAKRARLRVIIYQLANWILVFPSSLP